MSCADFAARVLSVREARIQQEARAAAEKRARQKETRRRHLASVMERADAIWAGMDRLMDQKSASAYEEVAVQLQDLRDAYLQAGNHASFRAKLSAFRQKYSHRPAMMRRIEGL
ncbi:MAG: hypothetical protein GX456_17350 [Verrucomicrobia bacterium]|nr:hypothetical protein [Verrucomicrobiota bacterium]